MVNDVNVTTTTHVERGFKKLGTAFFDVCIIYTQAVYSDLLDEIRKNRADNIRLPIYIIAQHFSKTNVLDAYASGIDDFFDSAFDAEILLIKISNVIRRRSLLTAESQGIVFGKYHLRHELRQLVYDGDTVIHLTIKEFELLFLMASNFGELVPKNQAMRTVWKRNDCFTSKCLDVYIWKLRKHLAMDVSLSIKNVRNSGFLLTNKN
ncbi:MAG: hypothetical protein CFE23_08295 [Flavobacterium sp. BFFFF1]|nr:MAG: hypothetical protein CFE23_08295 [Flavobacterium sp. BFFFF1]